MNTMYHKRILITVILSIAITICAMAQPQIKWIGVGKRSLVQNPGIPTGNGQYYSN